MIRITETCPHSLGYLIQSHVLKCDLMTPKFLCPFLTCFPDSRVMHPPDYLISLPGCLTSISNVTDPKPGPAISSTNHLSHQPPHFR